MKCRRAGTPVLESVVNELTLLFRAQDSSWLQSSMFP
jgi:hypothetical protein